MRFNRALILAFSVWAFSFAAHAQPAPASDADKAPTILACFNAGQTAVRDLRACAQAWLTPKALLLCALQNAEAGKAGPIACPFLPDTPNGRAILDALLAQQHLTRDSNLSLDTRNLPGAATVDACNKTASTQQDFLACIQSSANQAKTHALLQCIETSGSDTGRALCLAKSVTGDPALPAAVKCLVCKAPRLTNLFPALAILIRPLRRRLRWDVPPAPGTLHRRSPIVSCRAPAQRKKRSRPASRSRKTTTEASPDASAIFCLQWGAPSKPRPVFPTLGTPLRNARGCF
jgi:hypothetical protein